MCLEHPRVLQPCVSRVCLAGLSELGLTSFPPCYTPGQIDHPTLFSKTQEPCKMGVDARITLAVKRRVGDPTDANKDAAKSMIDKHHPRRQPGYAGKHASCGRILKDLARSHNVRTNTAHLWPAPARLGVACARPVCLANADPLHRAR